MRSFKSQAQLDQEAREAAASAHTVYPILKLLLIYARQSTKKQVVKNKESAMMQTVKLRELGLEHGWIESLTTVFIENMFDKFGNVTEEIRSASGSLGIDERAGLRIVTETIEQGNVGAIMVWAVDRLFRDEDMVMPAVFVRLCKDFNILVITPTDTFDFNNTRRDDRKRFLSLAQAAADYTTHHVKGRMLVGKHEKALRGEYVGHSVPTGLMLNADRSHYIANPVWSPIIARLFKRFRELDANFGALYREIYGKMLFPTLPSDLAARVGTIQMTQVTGGYTIKGRTSLQALLTNVAYLGHIAYKEHLIKNTHAAIVDTQDFMYAFNALSHTDLDGTVIERPERVVRYNQYNRPESDVERTEALLSGTRSTGRAVITAPDRSVYTMHYGDVKKEARYVMRTKDFEREEFAIRTSDIDRLVEARFLEHLGLEIAYEETESLLEAVYGRDENALETVSLVDHYKDTHNDVPTKLTTTENTREELQRGIARLEREYSITFDMMSDKEIRTNRETKARLVKQLSDLDKKQQRGTQEQADRQELVDLLDSGQLQAHWDTWKLEKKQKCIRMVTHEIVLEKVADTWLKLTIIWQEWLQKDMPHDEVVIVDTAYILRRRSGQITWSDEENRLVRAMYPLFSRRDILHALPCRSWASIRSQAVDLGVIREKRTNESGMREDMSVNDITFMQEHGLVATSPDMRVWWKSETCKREGRYSSRVIDTPSVDSAYILRELRSLLEVA